MRLAVALAIFFITLFAIGVWANYPITTAICLVLGAALIGIMIYNGVTGGVIFDRTTDEGRRTEVRVVTLGILLFVLGAFAAWAGRQKLGHWGETAFTTVTIAVILAAIAFGVVTWVLSYAGIDLGKKKKKKDDNK